MKLVKDNNVLICLDSISQVETWGSINPDTEIMIRINPNTQGVGHSSSVITSGKETKFGITETNFSDVEEKNNTGLFSVLFS
jgi:diaminopimelate decarboxylase